MRVDVSVWNLGLPLVLVGGCTRIELIPSDGDGGGSSSSTTTIGNTSPSTSSPSDPSVPDTTTLEPTSVDPSDTDPTMPGCMSYQECPDSNCCIENQCVYVGYCPPECPIEQCCAGMCGIYGCAIDDECDVGAVCELGSCIGIEMEYECMLPLQLEFQIPIPTMGMVSTLAFIDADGDAQRDVVVGTDTGVQLLRAFDLSLTDIDPGVYATSVAVADLDGDMDEDVLVGDALNGALRMLLHDPMVSFVPVTVTDMPLIRSLAVGDTDGDGVLDVMLADDMLGLHWLRGLGGAVFDVPTPLGFTPTAIAMGSLDGDALHDTVMHQNLEVALTLGNVFEQHPLYEESAGTYVRALAVGNFDGVPPDDVVALHTSVGTTIVTSWQNDVTAFVDHKSWWFGGTSVAARADLDDDGYDDLVAAGSEPQFVVAHGAPTMATSDVIGCVMTVPTTEPIVQLAIGDFTGDGELDVITWTGTQLAVYVQTG